MDELIAMRTILLLPLLLVLTAGCSRSFDGGYSLPLLYKIDIQQGNVIEQDMLSQLRPGMTQDKVKFIMGTPTIIDPFHSNRWEYIYSFQQAGGVREQRHITLHFKQDKLSHISGDIEANEALSATDSGLILDNEAEPIVLTDEAEEKGFFGRLWDKITP